MLTHYAGTLGFPVEVGQIIVIGGHVINGATKLEINLAGKKIENVDIPLQILVNFIENTISRNTKTAENDWGKPEINENLYESEPKFNPLTCGERFQFYILVGDEKFHISINGINFCTYKYRMPLNVIRSIIVCRDVQSVHQIDHRQIYPSPRPIVQFDNPVMVFSNDTPKQFTEGHVVIVTGIPYGNPRGMFLIRLTEEENLKKEILHFNPRFENEIVVRTHALGDGT